MPRVMRTWQTVGRELDTGDQASRESVSEVEGFRIDTGRFRARSDEIACHRSSIHAAQSGYQWSARPETCSVNIRFNCA